MAELEVPGHWPIVDELLRAAEATPNFRAHFGAQAQLLYTLSCSEGYYHIPPAHQQEVVARVMALVPRVGNHAQPRLMLEALFGLQLGYQPMEDMSRAVKVTSFTPRPLLPDERVYPHLPTQGFLGSFVNWAGECDTPLAYLYWGASCALSVAARARFYIDRGNDILRLQQYLFFVGERGTGKSVGLNAATELLHAMNCQMHGWKPGDKPPDFSKPHPFKVRFLPMDTNQQTLVRCLVQELYEKELFVDPDEWKLITGTTWAPENHGFLALDEAGVFFDKNNFAVDKAIAMLNMIASTLPYTYRTQVGGLIHLPEPVVTLLACTTVDAMQSSITPLLLKTGFTDRAVIVFRDPLRQGERKWPTPPARDPVARGELARWLKGIARSVRREELTADPEATDYMNDWYLKRPDPADAREHSIPRQTNHMWRIAGIHAVSDESAPWIRLRHFQETDAILETEWRGYRRLLGALEEDSVAHLMRYMERILADHGALEDEGWMKRSALFAIVRFKQGLTPPLVKAVPLLESLEAAGRISRVTLGRAEAYHLVGDAAEEARRKRSPSLSSEPRNVAGGRTPNRIEGQTSQDSS